MTRLLFLAAAFKVAAGLVVSTLPSIHAAVAPPALPAWYYVTLLAIFGASGAWLYIGGGRDARAQLLGVLLLAFGSLFTDRVIQRAAEMSALSPWLSLALEPIAATPLVAWCPFVFWQFAWRFPRVYPHHDARVHRVTSAVTLGAGLVLIAANLASAVVVAADSSLAGALGWLAPTGYGQFWQLLALLTVPPLTLLALKQRRAALDEQRRLAWIVIGVAIGCAPMLLHVALVTTISPYAALAEVPATSRALGIVLTAFTLVVPASVGYAALVQHTLDVRVVIRRAVQYALARYTVFALMIALMIAVAYVGYGNRSRPLRDIVAESPGAVATVVALGLVLMSRRRLLEAIDRRFFREQYDARQILLDLVERSEQAENPRDMIALVTAEIDRALHLERVALLVCDDHGESLRDPEGRVRALDVTGSLGALLSGSRTPLDVDLSSDASALSRLPESDREWLADAGARLIVPLFGSRGTPIGALLLGDKRSELPFSHEDRKLMTAVAASAAATLEQMVNRLSPDPDTPPPTPRVTAAQCTVCGRVQPRAQRECRACGGTTQEALLPMVLGGKFEVERQIGAGGMGVVYRARDLSLDRPVAMKVLPRVGTHAASRLRREARAMAMMQHPHLAVIHALESWRSAPVLVLEYLAGGTLADRLRHGPLPVREVVSIGLAMGDVLRHLHDAGYLHRDIKPSNIGFTTHGAAKLLDFGLVQLIVDLAGGSTGSGSRDEAADWGPARAASESWHAPATERQLIGTPSYMSPEALALEPPTPMVDLWGLAVSLYEAITGRNPFHAGTVVETVRLVVAADAPDARSVRPDCPQEIAAFLSAAMSPRPVRRPQTAADFVERLRFASAGLMSS